MKNSVPSYHLWPPASFPHLCVPPTEKASKAMITFIMVESKWQSNEERCPRLWLDLLHFDLRDAQCQSWESCSGSK